jgi:ABC-2 type transport system ATP-binding protein
LDTLIEARALRKSYGNRVAVDGVSLSVDGGEIYALVGPDGAGKTTTMRLLCGALSADAGEVFLAGINLHRQTELARAQLGYLPQRFSLYGDLTVLENLRFFAEVRGLPVKEWLPRSQEILEFVGLQAFGNRRADALSGGMKQKLGLATALVHHPRILLLDEPTGGVDAATRQAFWQLLIRLLRQGVAVLISTPYMDEAARCSRVGFMMQGRLLVEGPPDEIVQRLRGRVVEFVGGPRRLVERIARADPQVEEVQLFGDRLHLRIKAGAARQVIRRLKVAVPAQGGDVERVRQITPGLEDVFIDLLRRDE